MHRLRPALEAEGQAFEMVLEADRSVTRRVDGEARRLVEDDGLAIEEDHAVTEHGRALATKRWLMPEQRRLAGQACWCLPPRLPRIRTLPLTPPSPGRPTTRAHTAPSTIPICAPRFPPPP